MTASCDRPLMIFTVPAPATVHVFARIPELVILVIFANGISVLRLKSKPSSMCKISSRITTFIAFRSRCLLRTGPAWEDGPRYEEQPVHLSVESRPSPRSAGRILQQSPYSPCPAEPDQGDLSQYGHAWLP